MYCCRLSEVEQNEKIYDPLTADAPTGYYSVSEWNKPPEVATNKITNKQKMFAQLLACLHYGF